MTGLVARCWTSRDGLRLHAADYAAAEGEARLPIVCLHGLTRNSRDFDTLAPWLAARQRRVLAVDVRGRGLSARDPAADYRLPTYADDVARLLDALGIARALFVGTSMGGLITMELAATRPALIAGAVINDVGPEWSPVGLVRIASYTGKAMPVASWDDAAEYARRQNAEALPHYRAADWDKMARRLFTDRDGKVVADYDPNIAKPFAGEPLMIGPWTRWKALAIDRPILLLRGVLSDLLDREVAARMVAEQAGTRLVEVPGVGHAPMLDEPVAREVIAAFVDALP